MAFEVTRYRPESPGQIHIIAVDKSCDITRDSFEAFIDGMHLPAILFAGPVSQTVFVLFDYVDAFIRTAAVNDEVLQRLIVLLKDRADRLLKIFPLIERGRDDAELQGHQLCLLTVTGRTGLSFPPRKFAARKSAPGIPGAPGFRVPRAQPPESRLRGNQDSENIPA